MTKTRIEILDFPTYSASGDIKPFFVRLRVVEGGNNKVALVILNATGSPNYIEVFCNGTHVLRPNQWVTITAGDAIYDRIYDIAGAVRFPSGGEYTIVVAAGYT